MKKLLIIAVLVVVCSLDVESQSVFKVLRPITKKAPITRPYTFQRITVVETAHLERAIRAAELQSKLRRQGEIYYTPMIAQSNTPVAYLVQNIEQKHCKPEKLYGGYNYLKMCSSQFSGVDWAHINRTTSYNGVHHIVTVQSLKELYKISVNSYEKGKIKLYPFFNDMYKNAPSAFHILHNNPEYYHIFHNSELQLKIYNERGIKGILDNYFENIIHINTELNLPPIPEDVIKGTYVEAELWSTYFGLDWEK